MLKSKKPHPVAGPTVLFALDELVVVVLLEEDALLALNDLVE